MERKGKKKERRGREGKGGEKERVGGRDGWMGR